MTSDRLLADLRLAFERDAVVVAGAGVSLAATDNDPVAGWLGLIESGISFYEETGGNTYKAKRMRSFLDPPPEPATAAQLLTAAFGGRDSRSYKRWLDETVGSLEAHNPEVIHALLALDVPIVTTNYDTLIEDTAGNLEAVTWLQPDRVQEVLRKERDAVVHLHGLHRAPKSVVLDISSYEGLLHHGAAQELQQAMVLCHTLVFVGVGDGALDPNIGGLLKWLGQTFPNSKYEHFHLCTTRELAQVEGQDSKAAGVVPIVYGDDHRELAPFLRELAPRAGHGPGRSRAVSGGTRQRRRPTAVAVPPTLHAAGSEPWTATETNEGVRLFRIVAGRLVGVDVAGPARVETQHGRMPVDRLVATEQGSVLAGSAPDELRIALVHGRGNASVWPMCVKPPVDGFELLWVQCRHDVLTVIGSCDDGAVAFRVGPSGEAFAITTLHADRPSAYVSLVGGYLRLDRDGHLEFAGDALSHAAATLPTDGWLSVDGTAAAGVTVVAGLRREPHGTSLHIRQKVGPTVASAVVAVDAASERVHVARTGGRRSPGTVFASTPAGVVGWAVDDLLSLATTSNKAIS